MSRIVDRFLAVCEKCPDRTAVIYANKNKLIKKTYADLRHDVFQTAGYLVSRRVGQDDKIMVFAPADYPLAVFMLASFILGAQVMYVDIWARGKVLDDTFHDYLPDYVLISNKTALLFPFVKNVRKIKNIINLDKVRRDGRARPQLHEISEEAWGLLTLTTGSSGKPKLAIRTHHELFEQLNLVKQNIDADHASVVMITSYMYVFACLFSGNTAVMPGVNPGRMSAEKINQRLALFDHIPISMIITSPDFCLKANHHFRYLKTLYIGGAILSIREAKMIAGHFEGVDIIYVYGSTEFIIITTVRLNDYIKTLEEEHRSLLGSAVKGVDIMTDDEDILVSGSALLARYYHKEAGFNKKIIGGRLWHDTGDAGKIINNQLYYLGTAGHAITTDKKYYYSEIEQNILVHFRRIRKCAFLEKNHRYYLFLETDHMTEDEAIRSLLRDSYQVTDITIKVVKKIYRDPKHNTKINYQKLSDMVKE